MARIYSRERIVCYYHNAKKACPRYSRETLIKTTAEAHGLSYDEVHEIIKQEEHKQATIKKMDSLQ